MIAAQMVQSASVWSATSGQQCRGDEQLVGDRIEHPAERRLLLPDPREIAVEKIRDAGGDEDAERRPTRPMLA